MRDSAWRVHKSDDIPAVLSVTGVKWSYFKRVSGFKILIFPFTNDSSSLQNMRRIPFSFSFAFCTQAGIQRAVTKSKAAATPNSVTNQNG
jgi:hypothetical protein